MRAPSQGGGGHGPAVRTDLVDVYLFRLTEEGEPSSAEFLQVRRATPPLRGTWQPVMGHIERGERAIQTARRELAEEVGLHAGAGHCVGFWALEQVHPYFLAEVDAVMLSPRFAAQVTPGFEPLLDEEHDAARWVSRNEVDASFVWPGQRLSVREIVETLLDAHAPARDLLRLTFD
jgi:dATP pyrophosphohydrolase